jgi:DNA-binding IclR family transcriptional regulator
MPRKRAVTTDRLRVDGRLPLGAPAVKSAERVLKILEFFDDIQARATVMDIADTLGLPQSSTSSLLKSLVTLGYLEYEPANRTYLPTGRVALLGSWVNPQFVVGGKVIELMRELSHTTGHAIILVTRNGQYVQLIHSIAPRQPDRPYACIGTTRSILAASTGYALLSTLTDNEIKRIVMRHNADARGIEPPVDYKDVMGVVQKARHEGYVIRHSANYSGGGNLAMPLFGVAQRPLAIGVGSPVIEEIITNRQELVDLMHAAIERYFGTADGRVAPDMPDQRVARDSNGHRVRPGDLLV